MAGQTGSPLPGCLPRAIDSPIVRPQVKEYHKPGNHQKHPLYCY